MRNFLDAFETRKRSFISAFSIRMTVPLNKNLQKKLNGHVTGKYLLLQPQEESFPRKMTTQYLVLYFNSIVKSFCRTNSAQCFLFSFKYVSQSKFSSRKHWQTFVANTQGNKCSNAFVKMNEWRLQNPNFTWVLLILLEFFLRNTKW